MTTWYRKLTDYPENENNPFSEKAVLEISTTKKRQAIKPPKTSNGENKYWVIDNNGEKVAESLFVREVEVDEEQFAKVFLSGLLNFWELSPRGIRVFTYVLRQLRAGRDEFYFSASECMKFTLYKSRGLVTSGLAELIGAGLIARSTDPLIYFVNPLVVFNGSRVTFAKSYVRKQIQDKNPGQLALPFNPSLEQLREMAKTTQL
ncbi:RepA protein [Hymenobacter sp. UYP22]|uniref:RepA protein n=1 Tax=Hymenobacter sp. UYP22 TaxID=3156348 RepID=UPI003392A652